MMQHNTIKYFKFISPYLTFFYFTLLNPLALSFLFLPKVSADAEAMADLPARRSLSERGSKGSELISFNASDAGENKKTITLTFIVPEKDFIYKDFIHCSLYEPDIILSAWKENIQSIDYYDPSFNETKKIFNETFSISMDATITSWKPDLIHFYCSYYRKSEKKIKDIIFTFSFTQPTSSNAFHEEVEEMSINPILQKFPPVSKIQKYITYSNELLYRFIQHFSCNCYIYFYLLIIFTLFLYLLSHYYKKELEKYPRFKEFFIFSKLFSTMIAIICTHLFYLNFSTLHCMLAWFTSIYFGFLYLKKSSYFVVKALYRLSTFLGITLISISFILLVKALQF